jgi:hypothetical protein
MDYAAYLIKRAQPVAVTPEQMEGMRDALERSELAAERLRRELQAERERHIRFQQMAILSSPRMRRKIDEQISKERRDVGTRNITESLGTARSSPWGHAVPYGLLGTLLGGGGGLGLGALLGSPALGAGIGGALGALGGGAFGYGAPGRSLDRLKDIAAGRELMTTKHEFVPGEEYGPGEVVEQYDPVLRRKARQAIAEATAQG